jgi:anti-sigma regulatory factor (Ser/Thr protein kinase)
MCGTIGTARQSSAGGDARHACTAGRTGTPLALGSSRVQEVPPPADAQGNDFAGQWPLRSFLELGALPSAVPCARLHARQVLWEWRLTGDLDGTELVVSELVTNAVQRSRADGHPAPVRLWLLADRARVLVLVWDASPLPPVTMGTSEDAENGRGLLLVDAISERWGFYFPGEHGPASAAGQRGKVVWAAVARLTAGHPPSRGDSNGDINAGEGDDTVPGDRFSLGEAGG